MPLPFARHYRTLRFGRPIVVVSGLPRSGTSMAMGMVEAGGLAVMSDGVRVADESNPRGYYECERVKELDKDLDTSWLEDARGKALKIISFLLPYLPEANNYRVIFMHRRLDEIIASQKTMLGARGQPVSATTDGRMPERYEDHLRGVKNLLTKRPCFEVLDVRHGDVVADPREQAERIAGFLGGALDVSKMAAAVDPALYRSRS